MQDNGDGIPLETVVGMLNFDTRISSREVTRGISRGCQGNAAKTILALPVVLNGGSGRVTITARGVEHVITIEVDELADHPNITHQQRPLENEQFGTFCEITIADLPSKLEPHETLENGRFVHFLDSYACINPHLKVTCEFPETSTRRWNRKSERIRKRSPAAPDPPQWHNVASFARYAAACIDKDAADGADRTLRDFLKLFSGLTRTATLRAVCDETGLARTKLSTLKNGSGLNTGKVKQLLLSMQKHACTKEQLGRIQRMHVMEHLATDDLIGLVKYRKSEGDDDGLPFVVEAGFAERRDGELRIVSGCNFTPTVAEPICRRLDAILERQKIDETSPVTVLVHIAVWRRNS